MSCRTTLIVASLLSGLLLNAECEEAKPRNDILLEAEDFKGVGWKKSEMGYCWGAPHLWSRAKLEADAGDLPAKVTQTANIAKAGRYNLWVHYEDIAGFDSYFTVRVIQKGKERLVAQFGRKEASKFCPFAPTPLTTHDLRWWYHHGDIVYENREVDMEAGEANVVIEKAANGPSPAKRFIDFIYLTDDLEDNPIKAGSRGWFENFINRTADANLVYMRLTVSPDAPTPIAIHGVTYWPHQPPYYVFGQSFMGPKGKGAYKWPYRVPELDEFLKPGDSTPWMPTKVRTTGDNRFWMRAWPSGARHFATLKRYIRTHKVLFETIKEPVNLQGLRIEVAADPQGKRILRTITVKEPVSQFSVFMTRHCREPEHVTTWDEVNAARRKAIVDAKPIGRLPERFPITVGFWQIPRLDITRSMGETWPNVGKLIDGDTMRKHGFKGFKVDWYVGYVKKPEQQLYDKYRKLSQKRQEDFKRSGVAEGYPKVIKLIDEPSMWSLGRMGKEEIFHSGFQQYLKERKLPPEKFLSAEAAAQVARDAKAGKRMTDGELLKLIRLGNNKDHNWNPELYYHSQIYRSRAFADYYRPYTEIAHEVYGKECIGCPVNLAPNKLSFQQGWLDGIDYIDFFRSKGSTMMLSESWHDNVPGLVSQLDATMMDLFRCAAKYHGHPFGQYAICDTNRAIDGVSTAIKSLAIVSHGATFLEYYCGEGAYPGSTEGPILEQKDLLQEITRLNYAIGEVEDFLLDGELPKAEVALLWNRTCHIWDSAPQRRNFSDEWFNVYLQEFQWLHLALRHAGIWVDIVTEDDCAEGLLKDYRVLYLVGEQIQEDAAKAIRDWTERGGHLFSPAGGGLRNEYNRPLDTLKEVYGVTESRLTRVHRTMNLKVELPRQAAVDRLYSVDADFSIPAMDAFAFRQTFSKPTGKVLARFADRTTPATVQNDFGNGKAWICGALPGVAYMKPAVPVGVFSRSLEPDDLMHFRPIRFDDSVRKLITSPADRAGVKHSAKCDPVYVEAVVWKRGGQRLLILNNHSGKALDEVTVTLSGLGEAKSARSQQKQKIRMNSEGGNLKLRLPIRLYDFVYIE